MLRLCCYSKNGKQLKSTILCNRVTVLKHNEFRKRITNIQVIFQLLFKKKVFFLPRISFMTICFNI